MQDQPQQFNDYPTVQNYLKDMAFKDYTPAQQQERVTLLEQFCQFVERTPDQMVEELFDMETRKYKKRNFYTARVKEFSEQAAGSWQDQTARGNVIRNFFIANGRRLPNEKPDWL